MTTHTQMSLLDDVPEKTYTVEDLNPRSKAVKDLEMTLRRAIALSELCDRHLRLCDGDAKHASEQSPLQWGSMDKKLYKETNVSTLVKNCYGSLKYAAEQEHQWTKHFSDWYTGSLDLQIESLANCLPKKIGEKYVKSE